MELSPVRSASRNLHTAFLVEGTSVCMAVFRVQEKGVYVIHSDIGHVAAHSKDPKQTLPVRIANSVSSMLRNFERKNATFAPKDFIENVSFFYTYPVLASSREKIRTVNTDKRGVLTEKVLHSLIQKAEEAFFGSISSEPGQERNLILQRIISETKINGYPVTEYFGRSYHEFSAHISFSSISEALVTRVSDAVHSIYRNARINHFDAVIAALGAIEHSHVVPERFLCAFIGRSGSHVAFVNKMVPFTQKHFENGGEHMIRDLSHELSVTQSVARSYCEAHRTGMLHGKLEDRFVVAMKKIAEQWLADALAVRQDINEDFMLPKEMYLVTAGETDQTITEYMPGTAQDSVADHKIIVLPETLFPELKIETTVSLGMFERTLIHSLVS